MRDLYVTFSYRASLGGTIRNCLAVMPAAMRVVMRSSHCMRFAPRDLPRRKIQRPTHTSVGDRIHESVGRQFWAGARLK